MVDVHQDDPIDPFLWLLASIAFAVCFVVGLEVVGGIARYSVEALGESSVDAMAGIIIVGLLGGILGGFLGGWALIAGVRYLRRRRRR